MALPEVEFRWITAPQYSDRDYQVTGLQDAANKNWLVFYANSTEADRELQQQALVMQALTPFAPHLPFSLPLHQELIRTSANHLLAVHPALPGKPVSADILVRNRSLARSLGATLASLHLLPSEAAEQAKRPVLSAEKIRQGWLKALDQAAQTRKVPPRLWQHWEMLLEDVNYWHFQPAFIHSNLSEQCIYTDGQRITALSSVGQCHWGDPGRDLAWVSSIATAEMFEVVLNEYQRLRGTNDPHLAERIVLNSELVLLEWLLYGFRKQDQAIMADAQNLMAELSASLEATGVLPVVKAPDTATGLAQTVAVGSPDCGQDQTGSAVARPSDPDKGAKPAAAASAQNIHGEGQVVSSEEQSANRDKQNTGNTAAGEVEESDQPARSDSDQDKAADSQVNQVLAAAEMVTEIIPEIPEVATKASPIPTQQSASD